MKHALKSNHRFFIFCVFIVWLSVSNPAFGQFGSPVPQYPHEMDGLVHMKNRVPVFSETDISVAGRGLQLGFTRYYNGDGIVRYPSKASYLAHRWSHTYQWELRSENIRKGSSSSGYYYERYWSVITGAGEKKRFSQTGGIGKLYPSTRFNRTAGVRATLEMKLESNEYILTYITKHGLRYKFEKLIGIASDTRAQNFFLTEISDPNDNRLKLHYESIIGTDGRTYVRLIAVEDTVGRFLKFSYELSVPNTRQITKIEFGRGTKNALTTVYQTIVYRYPPPSPYSRTGSTPMAAVAHQLGAGDPRGSERVTQYEYRGQAQYLVTIVSPLGERIEFDNGFVTRRAAPSQLGQQGEVLHKRIYGREAYYYQYWGHEGWKWGKEYAFDSDLQTPIVRANIPYTPVRIDWSSVSRRREYTYQVTASSARIDFASDEYLYWQKINYNLTHAYQVDDKKTVWYYKLTYDGSHNRAMGNVTKWEQFLPASPHPWYHTTVLRKWEADYEDTYNLPIWQIDPMGHKTEFSYDSKGNLTQVKSKANTGTQPHAIDHDIVTTHVYDSYGNRTQTTVTPKANEQQVVQTVYDSTYHTYPIEVKTTITKDGATHTIKTKSEWDVHRGLKTADIDAGGKRTEYAYWKDRTLKYTKDVAANLYTVPTYDKDGNVTQVQVRQANWQTGPIVAQKKNEYDGIGRPVKANSFKDNWTTPYATTETTYDVYGDIATTKDPRGLITTYTYDNLGRLTKQTLPDGDWVETRYNTLNQPAKTWTKASGTEASPKVSYTYDILNRPQTVAYQTGESVAYTYDLGDNLLTLTTNDGSQAYTYTYTHDQLNRVITRNDSLLGYKTFYEYDDLSRRTRLSVRTSTGTTNLYDVTYIYDTANRLTWARDLLTSKTAKYDYFDIGAIKTTTLPNGITVHRTLDNRNRLDALQFKKDATTTLASLDYTYDVKSNVTQLVKDDTGAGGSAKTFTFGYDNISRLTRANYGTETVSYTYDKSGNRLTQVSTVDGTTNYTVATNSNQLTYRSLVPEDSNFSTMNYTYDAEGKLTKRHEGGKSDTFTYAYGAKLKQVQIQRPNTTQKTISYGYDGTGKRVKVTDSGGTHYFLYDGGMPVIELDTNKRITAYYLYGADGVVYRRIHGATPSQDKYEYHHVNALGSPVVITDDSKNVVARYEYDVFGAVRSQTGTTDNIRKFTGKEYDSDVRLYYYVARYYDPYIGRFTQRDPAGDGVNWYAYTYNNPLKFIDPTGLRGLTAHERDVATKIFGNTVTLDDIQIVDSGWRHHIATLGDDNRYLTIGNTIYGTGMGDSFLIHEVAHVWQYSRNQLDPVTGLAKHGVGMIRDAREGREQSLYYYTLDDKDDANRRTFGDYGFEQQAQILQDAYRFLFEGKRRNSTFKFNEWFNQHSDAYWQEYYETLLDEFQEYHRQLLDQESSSRGYLEFN